MSAVRHDTGKPRIDLIPPGPLLELAKVMTQPVTAGKYDEHNWRKGMAWSRVYAAAQRHMLAFWGGEDNDPESGLPHPAHAAFGMFTLLEYMNTQRQLDDRYVSQTRDDVLSQRAQAPAATTDRVQHEAVKPVPGGSSGPLVFGRKGGSLDGMEVLKAAEARLDAGRAYLDRAAAALVGIPAWGRS